MQNQNNRDQRSQSQNPYQQGNQDQWSQQDDMAQQPQDPSQQGYQTQRDQAMGQGQQQGMPPQQQTGQGQLGGARRMAEQQVDQAIDQFAQKIPGGQQYAQKAKDAASGILDNLEKEGENRVGGLGGMLGGILGQNKENQSQP